MDLPLDDHLSIGVQTLHRRTEPAEGPWQPTIDEMADLVSLVDRCGYDSMWVGDHVAFTIAIFDPLMQLAQAAVVSRRLIFGTDVYLLPLRHPTPVAKQVSTLDHLTEGRFVFGVGVGGEFPKEYEACGVPINERGARLSESITVMRKLWTGEPVSHAGKFFNFADVKMQPPPRQPGGPPIWCGGRSDPALRRTGRMTDGWMSYVVTPDMYRQGLEKIATAASEAGRTFDRGFGTAHLLFTRIDDTYEKALDAATASLSQRYAMDFRKAAQRYAALGTPQDVVETIFKFQQAGVRHLILDFVGPYEERDQQIERFAAGAMPLLAGLRGGR
ncbi:LLM class flavin-dependent oxidoreductase [Reyranella soli]|jgi:probable F420-dependent oxidoreductase|uniref:N5,N10-methylene tetrahydromethanopterin reductase n=1 Tax=Reyranella soli TaxID=1230389 RepID=A0A512N9G9_9HYPH|nr:LLM class flavin-dependent oxidoreductase [Reyranella soli]GEP55573.1 N5,N10-methylene tetrahydromethanopterin reductase [Reyranella soli]